MSVKAPHEPALAGLSLADTTLPETSYASALAACLMTVAACMARSSQRRALHELTQDKHLLSDIGLTREQALREAAKPFWRR